MEYNFQTSQENMHKIRLNMLDIVNYKQSLSCFPFVKGL